MAAGTGPHTGRAEEEQLEGAEIEEPSSLVDRENLPSTAELLAAADPVPPPDTMPVAIGKGVLALGVALALLAGSLVVPSPLVPDGWKTTEGRVSAIVSQDVEPNPRWLAKRAVRPFRDIVEFDSRFADQLRVTTRTEVAYLVDGATRTLRPPATVADDFFDSRPVPGGSLIVAYDPTDPSNARAIWGPVANPPALWMGLVGIVMLALVGPKLLLNLVASARRRDSETS